VGLGVLAMLALLLASRPAAAHVAIRLDVMAPQANQTIGPDSELVVVARPMLLGVAEVSFTATVDSRPLDPATGRVTDQPVPVLIRVNETKSSNHNEWLSLRKQTGQQPNRATRPRAA
jgi:hypothetical protein